LMAAGAENNAVLSELQAQYRELETKYEVVFAQRSELAKDKELLTASLAEVQEIAQKEKADAVESTKQQKEQYEKELAGLRETASKLSSYLETAKQQLAEKEDAIQKLRESHEESIKAMETVREERINKLRSSMIADKESEIQAIKSSYEEKLQLAEKSEREVMVLRDMTNKLSNDLEAAQQQRHEAEEGMKKLQESQHEYINAIDNLKAEHTKAIQQMRADMESNLSEDVTQQVSSVRSAMLAEKEAEMAALKLRAEEATQQLTEQYESEISQLKKKIDDLAGKLEVTQQQRADAEVEMKKLQEACNGSIDATELLKTEHAKAIEQVKADVESRSAAKLVEQVNEARSAVLAEKEAEIATLRADFDEKLQTAEKKEASFVESFNKVKTAYSLKLKKIQTELTEKVQKSEDEKAALVATNESLLSTEKTLRDAVTALELRLKDLLSEKNAATESLRQQYEATKVERDSLENKVTELQSQLDSVNKDLAAAASTEESSARIKELEMQHAEAIQKLENDYEDALQKAKGELEEARRNLETEVSERLDKQNAEFENELANHKRVSAEEKEEMRKSMEAHVDKMKQHFKEKVEAAKEEAASEIKKFEQATKEKDEKVAKLIDRLKSLTTSTANLRAENDEIKSKLQSELNGQKTLRAQLAAMKKEMEDRLENSSATASSLLEQQEKLEGEKKALSSQIATLRGERDVFANKVEELSGKLEALTANLSAMAEERKLQDGKLQVAMKNESKLKASEVEVADLREQINKLKLELTKTTSLVNRLQAEKDANERNHGQRTALVGMLESQLSELNDKNSEINAKLEAALYDLNQRDETIRSSEEQIRKLELEAAEAHEAAKRAAEAFASAQKGADSSAKTSKAVESLQKELQAAKQQMARKSAAAQRLLAEREAECADLRKANKALQQEVDKGSLSDRKIFELAAKQSNRESQAAAEIEARDKTIERMRRALVERDDQLANAEKQVEEAESQLEELFRARRREDVNLDYLKSIVVQYLSLPSGSNERASLLPVLATLLQFNAQDYQIIEEGKKKVSWWGSVAPTFIAAPDSPLTAPPVGGGSGEVSVSTPNQNGSQTHTSLQF